MCASSAWGVPMWCMCKAWLSTIGSKCVKHTLNDQNIINIYNHCNPQNLVLIGVQNNTKMSFEHFVKRLVCTYKINIWAMHEHEWKLPKYMLKCHKGTTQTQTNQMGLSPSRNWKNFFKIIGSQPFFENTQFKKNLDIFCII